MFICSDVLHQKNEESHAVTQEEQIKSSLQVPQRDHTKVILKWSTLLLTMIYTSVPGGNSKNLGTYVKWHCKTKMSYVLCSIDYELYGGKCRRPTHVNLSFHCQHLTDGVVAPVECTVRLLYECTWLPFSLNYYFLSRNCINNIPHK